MVGVINNEIDSIYLLAVFDRCIIKTAKAVSKFKRFADSLSMSQKICLTGHCTKKSYMYTHKKFSVSVRKFNGFADDGGEKFVEVDGKKFIDDGSGKPKLDDNQQPIPFVEKKTEDDFDLSKIDFATVTEEQIETIEKKFPSIAKLVRDKFEAEKKLAGIDADKKKQEEDDLKAKGELQKLLDIKEGSIADLTKKLGEKDTLLGKYSESVKSILKEVLVTIPKDKQGLIPSEFSDRQKLEYITKNAKLLGATIVGSGKIENNDGDHVDATEEEKMINRFTELQNKKDKTSTELKEMTELARKIKDAQKKKEGQK